MPKVPPKREPNCTECYYDDYADKWRYVSTCSVHGENKYPKPNYKFGGYGCKCTKTGPENTYTISSRCGLHAEQDFSSEHPVCDNCAKTECPPGCAGSAAAPEGGNTYRPPPSHYAGAGGLDPWTFIDAHGLDYWQGNVIKYVTRAGRKDIASRLDDLMKARDFINYMIAREERNKS